MDGSSSFDSMHVASRNSRHVEPVPSRHAAALQQLQLRQAPTHIALFLLKTNFERRTNMQQLTCEMVWSFSIDSL